jgi:hypothetical protein
VPGALFGLSLLDGLANLRAPPRGPRADTSPRVQTPFLYGTSSAFQSPLSPSWGPHRQSADRLDGFQADFSFLLGADLADPDHAAAHGPERVLIEDNFDHLATPEVETSAQPETSKGCADNRVLLVDRRGNIAWHMVSSALLGPGSTSSICQYRTPICISQTETTLC